ncbi:MAG: DUF2064 domain-containing protein [Robiginitomaculum sp.]|nr:DUF2064 domain-containing protein [Robiginitomaculum sp.]
MQIPQTNKSPALVLFFRRPKPGVGKQRLAITIGQQQAYWVSKRMLDCALEDMARWDGPLVFAVANLDDVNWVKTTIIPKFSHHQTLVIAQSNGNLGERLHAIDHALTDHGFTQRVYIGSDAPVLHSHLYKTARNLLRQNDTVLAKSADGGVTLMASKQNWPDMKALPWSTKRLCDALAASCREANLNSKIIDGLYDVDTLADLRKARIDLEHDQRPARRAFCHQIDRLSVTQEMVTA